MEKEGDCGKEMEVVAQEKKQKKTAMLLPRGDGKGGGRDLSRMA